MAEEWARNGASTLHAVLDRNFSKSLPLWPMVGRSASANYLFNVDFPGKARSIHSQHRKQENADRRSAFSIRPAADAVEKTGPRKS